jgi:L-threonylcarbamoyladenylate synthase
VRTDEEAAQQLDALATLGDSEILVIGHTHVPHAHAAGRGPLLRGRAGTIARALLPGAYTLVLPNPGRRYRWLTGSTPDAIGVRVPDVSGAAAELLKRAGAYAASSANARGGADPCSLDEVPDEIRAVAAAELDCGVLPGTPSTVLDFTGREPRVLREGAAPSDEALRIVAHVL